ncbi:HlyD family secretion protein [Rosistilla ulvae]|uniref:HlyD family secretion protein n=1 Tax=Rosistilla ulvae TaxID=1930277 RepID=A0A517LWT1_9BACT|nr:efflux RND transporter periplasmic adaptor subunit [Rosistilla ulvae]QDS87085.1 HlyD family secretion protein [Rosistilla ulvae]
MQKLKPSEILLPHPHVERFFAQVDRICALRDVTSQLFPELIDQLIDDGIVSSAALWCRQAGQTSLLARSSDWRFELPQPFPETLLQATAGSSASLPLGESESIESPAGEAAITSQRIVAGYCGGAESFLIFDGVIEPGASLAAIRQRQEILEGFAEIAGNRWVRHRFETLSQQPHPTDLTQRLIDLMVDSKSLEASTRTLAAELLAATNVDRVSLLQCQAGKTRLLAMAPAGNIDHRSTLVRRLEALVTQVSHGSGTLSYSMGLPSTDASPESLLEYVDESECRQLDLMSDMQREDRPSENASVVVVLERFNVDRTTTSHDRDLGSRALPVLRHLVERHDHGWRRYLQPLRQASPARNAAIVSLVGLVILLALMLIPGDFWIPVDGHLHPVASQGVFAPSDGVVEQLYVANGAEVARGEKLLAIRDPQLELRGSELDGQIATLKSQLASVQATRGQAARDPQRTRSGELSAQEQDLEIQLAGLQRQRDVVTKHRQQLEITSPLSGKVQRWDMEHELRDRPVAHGQHLLDVIDADSAWELRLDVPDHLIGYVVNAQREGPLPVNFRIRSDPGQVMPAVVASVAESTQIDPQGRTTVLVSAAIDDDLLDDPRIGAGVVARIDCGRRSLAFIWFRELIEFCQSNFYF